MIFRTKNSIYELEQTATGEFQMTKLKELNWSHFNEVGQTRTSKTATVKVGEPARFDGWHTSPVTEITP